VAQARRLAHPVLFYNPFSGGGKAERFALAEQARRRGIEPIELKRGDDLEQLVRDAVKRGADAISALIATTSSARSARSWTVASGGSTSPRSTVACS
jgi:hypothetical protein